MSEYTLPQHRYIGEELSDEDYRNYRDWASSPQRRQEVIDVIGEELPLTAEQQAQASSVFDATTSFCKDEFDIDVSDRMPTVKDIHVLATEDFKALSQKFSVSDHGLDVHGFPMTGNQMILRETPNKGLTATLVQHEVLHMIAGGTARFTRTDSGIHVDSKNGFFRGNSYSAIEEYAVETTSREIIATRWQNYTALQDLEPVEGHEDVIELGDTVLGAGVHDTENRLRDLQLAHITGYPAYLARLNAELRAEWGPEVMRELVTAQPGAVAGQMAMRLMAQHQAHENVGPTK